MILETERLSLRPLAVADAELLFPILSDPEVMAHWDIPEVDDPDLVRAIVEGQVAEAQAGKAAHWTIRTLGDEFLGACDLSDIDRWHKRAEIGFLLGRGAWGQGYALEAMRSVVSHAATMGLRRLSARTHLGNLRSDTLLEKLGFQEEGLLRGHILRDGEHRDCRLFGLLL
ncbi:GNAT family N-acetyltransferase [Phenylobacterium sp.]|uniref:GNAT family N-acetyltransferase n=1 Tax=Phenylobacterium sp. TaxID=1871053 RepID=UPI00289BF0A1|nr:GNAT family N-acetyltransferase [Phenylobacterium sp.]